MKAIMLAMLSLLTCCSKPPALPPDALPHYEILSSEPARQAERAPLPERKPSDINGDIAEALNRAELATHEALELTKKETGR